MSTVSRERVRERKTGAIHSVGVALTSSSRRGAIRECAADKERNSDLEGRSIMKTAQNKKKRLSFHRPSQYPLPHGLLIAFEEE